MAAVIDKHAVASGFDAGDAARRRNVAGAPQPAVVKPVEADDKKKVKKVSSASRLSPGHCPCLRRDACDMY